MTQEKLRNIIAHFTHSPKPTLPAGVKLFAVMFGKEKSDTLHKSPKSSVTMLEETWLREDFFKLF